MRIFSSFYIKMIAVITMLVDHGAHIFLFGVVSFDEYLLLRGIGRIAFPLFVYLIAQGCKYSKKMELYVFRLGLFALISEIPFDLAFRGGNINFIDFLNDTNIFYTLFLGVLAVYIFQKMMFVQYEDERVWRFKGLGTSVTKENLLGYAMLPLFLVPLFGIMALADWLGTDYGGLGVLFIVGMGIVVEFKHYFFAQLLIIIVVMTALYGLLSDFWLFSLISIVVIVLGNGKLGPKAKWFFYITYPAHLLLFFALDYTGIVSF